MQCLELGLQAITHLRAALPPMGGHIEAVDMPITVFEIHPISSWQNASQRLGPAWQLPGGGTWDTCSSAQCEHLDDQVLCTDHLQER